MRRSVEPWHLWAIAALTLLILELLTAASGFLLLCFAVGCLASTGTALAGLGIEWQLLVFSVTSIAAIYGLRPFFLTHFHRGGRVKTNVDALVGKVGVVSQRIESQPTGGRALVEGEDWWAVSLDDSPVATGERVKVLQVDGSKLVVEPI